MHGVGDGATWIAVQTEERFGDPSRFLLDCYHLCDYLAPASRVCAPHAPKSWIEQQKIRLKQNHFRAFLKALKPFREPNSVPDAQALTRAIYRYLDNRPQHLDYKSSIAAKLPIGSGEIERAHRYIIQARLKRSGSWWTVERNSIIFTGAEFQVETLWELVDCGKGWVHVGPESPSS